MRTAIGHGVGVGGAKQGPPSVSKITVESEYNVDDFKSWVEAEKFYSIQPNTQINYK